MNRLNQLGGDSRKVFKPGAPPAHAPGGPRGKRIEKKSRQNRDIFTSSCSHAAASKRRNKAQLGNHVDFGTADAASLKENQSEPLSATKTQP